MPENPANIILSGQIDLIINGWAHSMQKHNIKEWLVRLKGTDHDLAELPSVFNFPESTITRLDNHFYLKSTELNAIKTASEVRKASKLIIQVLNGAAKLHFEFYSQVEVDNSIKGIDDNGQMHSFGFGGGTGRRINSTYEDPTRVRKWLSKAICEKNSSDMLRFFSEQSWFSLYKIHELLKEEVGDVTERGWATKQEKKRFTQTAQSQESLGDAARHATKKFKPHSNPMSLTEARAFIKGLLLEYFCSLTE